MTYPRCDVTVMFHLLNFFSRVQVYFSRHVVKEREQSEA